MTKWLLIVSVIYTTACTTQQQNYISNYDSDLKYPAETENFVFKNITVFDEPLFGVGLTYIDKQYPDDIITVYVYPIPMTTWDNDQYTLNSEMDRVFREIDQIVKEGEFLARSSETRQEFSFRAGDKKFSGLKASFDFELAQNQKLDSDTFIFISKDKFIKFRASFFSDLTPDWAGEKIVKELLPALDVPEESNYMRMLRTEKK